MRPNTLLIPTAALLILLGCNSASHDGSKVLANVGGEKITEGEFKQILESTGAPAAEVQEFLTNPKARDQRAQFLSQVAMGKALVAYGKMQGLDQDPKVKQAIDQATAKAYFQALLERRVGKAEPNEAQMKETYDELVAERTAMGQAQGLPKFEEVKGQLPQLWKQRQMQKAQEGVKKEMEEHVAMTFDEGWRMVGH